MANDVTLQAGKKINVAIVALASFSLNKQVKILIMNIYQFKACELLRQQTEHSHIHFPLIPGLLPLKITFVLQCWICFQILSKHLCMCVCLVVGVCVFFLLFSFFFFQNTFFASLQTKLSLLVILVRKDLINPEAEHFGNYSEAPSCKPPSDLQSAELLKISVLITLTEQAEFSVP